MTDNDKILSGSVFKWQVNLKVKEERIGLYSVPLIFSYIGNCLLVILRASSNCKSELLKNIQKPVEYLILKITQLKYQPNNIFSRT